MLDPPLVWRVILWKMTTSSFKKSVIQDGGYIPLVLLRITHPDIPRITLDDGSIGNQVVRVVRDNLNLTREENGQVVEYYRLPFDIVRPTAREGELPVIELKIDRLDGTIAKFVDLTGGAKDADVEFIEIDRLHPEDDERTYRLKVKRTKMTMSHITFTLSFPNLYKIQSVQQIYQPATNPGLFE